MASTEPETSHEMPAADSDFQPFVVACAGCGDFLDKPGALLFSPPLGILPVTVAKYHICADKCLPLVMKVLHA